MDLGVPFPRRTWTVEMRAVHLHPRTEEWITIDRHERCCMRVVLEPRAVVIRDLVQQLGCVRTDARERYDVLRTRDDVHGVELQHARPAHHAVQMAFGR